jgi:hypothetical protein
VTATFLVGDVHDRMAELADGSFDFILCSPPFLALRSYLPPGHPDKDKEIGSEPTPAAYLDVLLELTAEWGRLLAPHGSIAIELGDTYSGSGGAGGDYDTDGLREGQPRFRQNTDRYRGYSGEQYGHRTDDGAGTRTVNNGGPGWPLENSLCAIPQLYMVALAYGINPLTGQPSPAGRWRIRNLKPWIRSNPPVGALGQKERPATSYITVACQARARDRWFDLDAVRTTPSGNSHGGGTWTTQGGDAASFGVIDKTISNPAGAPPRDWWHHIDAILDAELDARAGQPNGSAGAGGGGISAVDGSTRMGQRFADGATSSVGAQGVHLRRALERAGILRTLDALDVSPKGYAGAHYAVWPPELVRLLVDEMCPRKVCTTCGVPSRRITETVQRDTGRRTNGAKNVGRKHESATDYPTRTEAEVTTLGWSDCGHNTWRPGRILDPFVGSGTTLAVATGMARDATGIDIDERNAHLATERCGMFLTVHWNEVPA